MTAVVEFDVREQAAQRFEHLGWPTPRLEEWKYTNLAPVRSSTWSRASTLAPAAAGERVAEGRVRGALAEYVFINGIYARDLSTPLDSLAMSRETKERHYARYADYENHAMTALNTANAQDCAMLQIALDVRRSEDLCLPTERAAPQAIHLPQAVLGHRKTKSEIHIER